MSEPTKITILGAGKIGRAITRLLHHTGDYQVRVGDISDEALNSLVTETPVDTTLIDVGNAKNVIQELEGQHAVVSACSFDVNEEIAKGALQAGISYFDLTEDVATTKRIRALAAEARPGQIFMPQCGLAPGFISILAYHLCQEFDKLDRVKMRVGALPLYPDNMLKYNLTWSTDGLINEYCNPCEAIRDGRRVEVQPLEGLEQFALDGVDYEAFNTSGGLGTLCETLVDQVAELDYKTVRYVGHRYLMSFLLHGLRFQNQRPLLKKLLEAAVPCTDQDVVLVFSTVTGWKNGEYRQISDARKVYHGAIHGVPASSIQITTATSACAVVDLWREGKLPQQGFVRQEDVTLTDFLANRFGAPYLKAQQVRAPIASETRPEVA